MEQYSKRAGTWYQYVVRLSPVSSVIVLGRVSESAVKRKPVVIFCAEQIEVERLVIEAAHESHVECLQPLLSVYDKMAGARQVFFLFCQGLLSMLGERPKGKQRCRSLLFLQYHNATKGILQQGVEEEFHLVFIPDQPTLDHGVHIVSLIDITDDV